MTSYFDLSRRPNAKVGIEMQDFCREAKRARCTVADIRTVDEVESAGSGFLSTSKRPKILFEGHYFYNALEPLGFAKKAQQLEPTICYPKWRSDFYIGREGEYSRLAKATELCRRFGIDDAPALGAASWGRFQIMGVNYKKAGFSSLDEYLDAMFTDEDQHLTAFINYLINTKLDDDLREHRWTTLASGYNGPGYRRNNYHIKLPNAWKRFSRQSVDCESLLRSTAHVVAVMPGERASDPDVVGFENTSLDDRYAPETSGDDGTGSASEGSQQNSSASETEGGAEDRGPEASPNDNNIEQTAEAGGAAVIVQADKSEEKKIESAQNQPPVEINAPASSWFMTKFWGIVAGITGGTYALPSLDLSPERLDLFKAVLPYVAIGALIALAIWYFTKTNNQFKITELVAKINTDQTIRDVVINDRKHSSATSALSFASYAICGFLIAIAIGAALR